MYLFRHFLSKAARQWPASVVGSSVTFDRIRRPKSRWSSFPDARYSRAIAISRNTVCYRSDLDYCRSSRARPQPSVRALTPATVAHRLLRPPALTLAKIGRCSHEHEATVSATRREPAGSFRRTSKVGCARGTGDAGNGSAGLEKSARRLRGPSRPSRNCIAERRLPQGGTDSGLVLC